MLSFEADGLNEAKNDLEQTTEDCQKLSETEQIPFNELFPASFMNKYTSFSSIDKLINSSGFKIETQEDFDAIPDNELDKYISDTTTFHSWEDMQNEAFSQYIENNLNF